MAALIIIVLLLIVIYTLNKDSYSFSKLFHMARNSPAILKQSYQRARRGYSDRDVVYMDAWASEVIPAMLRQLAQTSYSHPQDCKDLEQWQRELNKMALNIQSAYVFNKNNQPPRFSKAGRQAGKLHIARRKRAGNKTKKGWYQFANRFFELWD